MKIAIVHSGAKPEALPDRKAFDVVIAVDEAAALVEADWWVVSLGAVEVKPKGKPGIFANSDIANHLSGELPPEKVKRYEPLLKTVTAPGWSLYPSAAAVVLARDLGAKEITQIGAPAVGGRAKECVECESEILKGLK